MVLWNEPLSPELCFYITKGKGWFLTICRNYFLFLQTRPQNLFPASNCNREFAWLFPVMYQSPPKHCPALHNVKSWNLLSKLSWKLEPGARCGSLKISSSQKWILFRCCLEFEILYYIKQFQTKNQEKLSNLCEGVKMFYLETLTFV